MAKGASDSADHNNKNPGTRANGTAAHRTSKGHAAATTFDAAPDPCAAPPPAPHLPPNYQGHPTAEHARIAADRTRAAAWKRWGTFLPERQWGTVREDYSADGNVWDYFTHDHARSRAYRWGEDGLLGFCDRQCRLCFSVALWNENDPILKERLFGLSGNEGNHGEDVKEAWFYLDNTPTHSYCRAIYKYPQAAYPYAKLVQENRRRSREDPEYDIENTGVFDEDKYFDVEIEYAKAEAEDLLIRVTVHNRGSAPAPIHVLPQLWFRNTWSWGSVTDECPHKPRLSLRTPHADDHARSSIEADHSTLGMFDFFADAGATDPQPATHPLWLFTENDTNAKRLFNAPNPSPFVKDAFHDRVVHGIEDAVNPLHIGTKAAAWHNAVVPAHGSRVFRFRLVRVENPHEIGPLRHGYSPAAAPEYAAFGGGSHHASNQAFDAMIRQRRAEADDFYANIAGDHVPADHRHVSRQAYAGLLWSKQYYAYIVKDWLDGDPTQPKPPAQRRKGRNTQWRHMFNRDVISMPDKWEYPWYAAWDLAFHMLPFSTIDADFAKDQLMLFLREWYMHPSGQIPAYEFALDDVNPPVHAWACWRIYKRTAPRGQRDRLFLARTFQKLMINFTWWVNRKDPWGANLFSGGFLGLDNISIFDRSQPLPRGAQLAQADGTAWMAFSCGIMLSMALELARTDAAYEDMASKFFEHFISICDSMNNLGGSGLWDEADGFYYDQIVCESFGSEHAHAPVPLKVRSLVGLVPLLSAVILESHVVESLPGFLKRTNWFIDNRRELSKQITYLESDDRIGRENDSGGAGASSAGAGNGQHLLLAIPSRERLVRVLRYVFDENEFLSPHGIRSLSRVHAEKPFELHLDGRTYSIRYTPGESNISTFGGNSNWRGPVWLPLNYLIIEALERYARFFGDSLKIEVPTGSGRMMNLYEAAGEIRGRLMRLFLPDAAGNRPCHAGNPRFVHDPHWRNHLLFHEYFHGDTGQGLGAAHQTGWTALIATILEDAGLGPEASAKAQHRWTGGQRTKT
jgi:hypothetical protein